MNKWAMFLLLTFVIFQAGCKSPFDRTRDASGGGALGTFSTSGNLTVYSNELQTGGGAFLYPSGENQILSFNDTSNPISARSIRYTWNGQSVASQIVFAGFDLMHTPTQATYSSTVGRDLRAAGYTRVRFWARGSLSANTVVKIEVADDGNTGTAAPCVTLSTDGATDATGSPCGGGRLDDLTATWQQYTITIANSDLAALKDFFKATIIFNGGGSIPGGGGTVFFDQIEYLP